MAAKTTAVATPSTNVVAQLTIDQILNMTKAEREACLGMAPASESGTPLLEGAAAYAGAAAAAVADAVEGVPSAFMLAFRANRRY
jgi:hypothetical protein